MPTGPEMLNTVLTATNELPADQEYWLDIPEKLDLCKLRPSDLESLGYGAEQIAEVTAALSQQNVGPLGTLIGHPLKVKFRVLALRHDPVCSVRCQGEDNATWMRAYLVGCFPDAEIAQPHQVDDTPMYEIDLNFDGQATPYTVQQALLNCPAALLVQLYQVRVAERPHYKLESHNLAAWIEDQGEDVWWTVDGDPLLMSRLEFPAPPDELGSELHRIGRSLIVADPSGQGANEELTPDEVGRVVSVDDFGNRHLLLSWQGGATDWTLAEDEPVSDASST